MWLTLERGQSRRFTVTDRQAIWPASEFSDAELVVSTRAELHEEILLATTHAIRLGYRIDAIESSFAIDGSNPVPWREALAVKGHSFEIMLTTRGAIHMPAVGSKLPNRLATWLATIAEDVRASWPPLPAELRAGDSWSSAPVAPGGVPPGATSMSVDVSYRAGFVSADSADVEVRFSLKAGLDSTELRATSAIGEGTMDIHLEKRAGPVVARRTSSITLVRSQSRDQVVRASVDIVRPALADGRVLEPTSLASERSSSVRARALDPEATPPPVYAATPAAPLTPPPMQVSGTSPAPVRFTEAPTPSPGPPPPGAPRASSSGSHVAVSGRPVMGVSATSTSGPAHAQGQGATVASGQGRVIGAASAAKPVVPPTPAPPAKAEPSRLPRALAEETTPTDSGPVLLDDDKTPTD
jgi:hypothetical protein